MFEAACDSVLTSWATEEESSADFIEAYQYTESPDARHDFRTGHLSGSQISTWLNRPPPAKATGGFRLLICERQQYSPLDFPITQADFKLAQRVFHLHASTLAIFDSDAGSFSQYRLHSDLGQTEVKRVGVVIKAPQKREIANYGLSCSYDVSTSITTALLYGTNVPYFDNHVSTVGFNLDSTKAEDIARKSRESSRHRRSRDVPPAELIMFTDDRGHNRGELPLVRSLREARDAWHHPLLLPSTVLTEHIRRAKLFCNTGKVMKETWAIEGELGVTYLGRWVGKPIEGNKHKPPPGYRRIERSPSSRRDGNHSKGGHAQLNAHANVRRSALVSRSKAEELTVRINTQSLRILFTARSPQWNSQCSQAMRDLLNQLGTSLPKLDARAHEALRELLEYNISTAESVGSHVASMKERMALQLEILYSMVAQMDNRLSARLAASAGRDSTSMKILAFITAVYLPAQAVATFFGMSMFAWPHSGGSNESSGGSTGNTEVSIVSNWFWLYWAVTVPLTLITLGGWGAWWVMEMRRFKGSYAEALGEAEEESTGRSASSGIGDADGVTAVASNPKGQESRGKELRARLLRREPDEEQATTMGAEKANGGR